MRSSLLFLALSVVFAVVASAAPNPVLTRGLTNIRAEFNAAFPKRDKTTDGWIGNPVELRSPSGHNPDMGRNPEYRDGDSKNEVRAIDVDKDLRAANGVTMEDVVQYLLGKLRSGTYLPFRYIIYNQRIWERSRGWQQRAYSTGPHDQHAHFSGDYSQKADEWTGKLGLASVKHNANNNGGNIGGGGGSSGSLPKYANGSRENSKKKNNKGTDVKALQKFIGSKCGTADGSFGDKTEACVKWYQGVRKLTQDGVAGAKTWAPILKALKGRRLRGDADEANEPVPVGVAY